MKRSKSSSPEPLADFKSKRPKAEESAKEELHKDVARNLLDLSEDVLLQIMKNLRAVDLINLGRCCQILGRIVRDRTLWENVEFCSRLPEKININLKHFTEYLHPMTKSLTIFLDCSEEKEQLEAFFNDLVQTCVQLKELVLDYSKIDANKVQVKHFPATLEKLSMKGTEMINLAPNTSYFSGMHLLIPNLTCCILSNCDWLETQSLMPLSKLPKLTELRLDSCRQMYECLAYASLAARCGFKALEILDVRNTALGDSDISSFSFTETLTHMYLENPSEERQIANLQPFSPCPYFVEIRLYRDGNINAEVCRNNREMANLAVAVNPITDRAVFSLSSYLRYPTFSRNGEMRFDKDENQQRMLSNPKLKVLVVRNYPEVTDRSLCHLTKNAPSLEYLDVTGTSVTHESVALFRSKRPNVKLVTSFDED